MRVRALRAGDEPALVTLCDQLGYPSTREQVERRLRGLLASPNDACLGAEDDDGTLLGWIHLQERHLLESEPFIEICGLVVDESRRGKRIGQALVEAGETWASQRGCKDLRVRSNITRTAAHRFYQRLGYLPLKTSHVFGKKARGIL